MPPLLDASADSPPRRRRAHASLELLLRYGSALIAVALCTLARQILDPVLGMRQPFLIYFPGVIAVAWYGGIGPALVALLLASIVATWFFIPPTHAFAIIHPADYWSMGVFLFVGLATALLSEAQRRARQRADKSTAAVEESQRRLSITLRSIGDAVITTGTDGKVTLLNPVAEALTGWSEADALGKPCEEVFHIVNEFTRESVQSPHQRALSEGVVVGLANHTLLIARDGVERPIDDSGAPILDAAGEPLGAVLVFRDVTGRRRSEQEKARILEQEQAARADAEQANDRLTFLAEVSRVLSSSLDYQTTLDQVAHLVVPILADWCDIQVRDETGAIRRVAVYHSDPAKVALAYEMDRRYPANPDDSRGVPYVLRTGQTDVYTDIPDELLEATTRDEEQLRLLRELGLKSALVVPLIARGQTLGAISLIYAESNRHYNADDQRLAEDLALRAGTAVDNARLYTEAQAALQSAQQAVELHQTLEQKLTLLAEATSTLLGSLDPQSVLSQILALSHRLVAADAYAIWRRDPETRHWVTVCVDGLSESYRSRAAASFNHAVQMPDHPIITENLEQEPMLAGHSDLLLAEGVRSLLVMPLKIQGEISGTLVFYYHQTHRFEQTDLKVAGTLSNLAASAIDTAELYEELRRRAIQLAEEDRRKDEFLAMLAHELRNPLAAITNAIAVLSIPGAGESAFRHARDVAARQAQHTATLVDELLDISRISRGKFRVAAVPLDLKALVQSTCEDHVEILRSGRLTLELTLSEAPIWVEGDPTRLKQVLGNLLQNAAKFTDPGGNVTVIAEPDYRNGRAIVTVTDTGIGIAADFLPRLFEPFVQAERSFARTRGGLGLGLALVKTIAEMHGGTITARSEGPGRGSSFRLELPLRSNPPPGSISAPDPTVGTQAPNLGGDGIPPTAVPVLPTAGQTQVHTTPIPSLNSCPVLVIEDNPDAAETMRDMLELFGHPVELALSGPDGIAVAQRLRPRIVICDIGLPGMDGYAVASALRSDPATSTARLIALSGYGQEEHRQRASEAGFDVHLTKPVDPVRLREILDQLSDG